MEEPTIGKLTELVVNGFSAMEKRSTGIEQRLTGLEQEFTAFRSEVREELRAIRADLSDIQRRLGALTETVEGMKGYAKEIDELRARVRALEAQVQDLSQAQAA